MEWLTTSNRECLLHNTGIIRCYHYSWVVDEAPGFLVFVRLRTEGKGHNQEAKWQHGLCQQLMSAVDAQM